MSEECFKLGFGMAEYKLKSLDVLWLPVVKRWKYTRTWTLSLKPFIISGGGGGAAKLLLSGFPAPVPLHPGYTQLTRWYVWRVSLLLSGAVGWAWRGQMLCLMGSDGYGAQADYLPSVISSWVSSEIQNHLWKIPLGVSGSNELATETLCDMAKAQLWLLLLSGLCGRWMGRTDTHAHSMSSWMFYTSQDCSENFDKSLT